MAYVISLTGWALLVPALITSITALMLRSIVIRAWATSFAMVGALGVGMGFLSHRNWAGLAVLGVLLGLSGSQAVSIYRSQAPPAPSQRPSSQGLSDARGARG